jgi:hypothetical protein
LILVKFERKKVLTSYFCMNIKPRKCLRKPVGIKKAILSGRSSWKYSQPDKG